jgi:hypothetical protein
MASASVDFHDFRLHLHADDDTVLAAAAARFTALDRDEHGVPRATLEFEFVAKKPDVSVPAGSRQVYESERGSAWYAEHDDLLTVIYADVGAAVCRPRDQRATITVDPAAEEGPWTATRPLFTLSLAELLKRHGVYFLHAAGVAHGSAAILLPGTSGSGKSTLSVALAQSGFGFLGDDTVFLTGESVLAFPDEIDLSDESLALLGQSAEHGHRIRGRGKWQIAPRDAHCAVVRSARPVALVFPAVGAATAALQEIRGSDALLSLAPNVLLTEAESTRAHLDALADLAQSVPSYALELGPQLADAVDALAGLAALQ